MNKHATFLDGEARHKQHLDTFPIPTKKQKRALEVGDWVKVCLEDRLKGERFWVELTAINGLQLTGKVINFAEDHGVDYGDTLSFETRHVLDIDPFKGTDPVEAARAFLRSL